MDPCEIQIQIQVIEYEQDFIQGHNQQQYIENGNQLIEVPNQTTLLQIDRQFLQQHIPGRKQELHKLIEYLESLRFGHQGPLCISGSTGCGKTSMVNLVLKNIPEVYNYQTAYINCIQVFSAKKIYALMLQSLFDKRSKKPEKQLEKLINNDEDDYHKILILDEIDQFTDKKSFIYNILQWCQNSNKPFGLILISNMVDLTERLQSKLRSRIKFNQIIFPPYSYQILVDILAYKYQQEIKRFDRDSILYLCKKIANDKSDVRILERCFKEILEAFPIQENNYNQKIKIGQIQNRLYHGSEQRDEILKPYEFLLDIFARTPKNSDISQQVMNQYRLRYGSEANHQEILYFLCDLQDFDVIEIKDSRVNPDMKFEHWGINLKGFFYLLYSNKKA